MVVTCGLGVVLLRVALLLLWLLCRLFLGQLLCVRGGPLSLVPRWSGEAHSVLLLLPRAAYSLVA